MSPLHADDENENTVEPQTAAPDPDSDNRPSADPAAPGRIVDPGIKVRPVTDADVEKAAKLASFGGAKGGALLSKKCGFLLMKAADLEFRGLNEMEAEKVAGLVDLANVAEGKGLDPVTVPENEAGFKWLECQTFDFRRRLEDQIVAIYGERFEDDGEGNMVSAAPSRKPKVAIGYVDTPPAIVVNLHYPITVDGERHDHIDLWPASYGTILAVQTGEMTRHAMIAEMANISPEALEGLRFPDAERVIGCALDMAPTVER